MNDPGGQTSLAGSPRRYWRGSVRLLRRLWHRVGGLLPERVRVAVAERGLHML